MEMEASLSTMTYESGILEYDDFPLTLEPVYILGKVYSALHDRDELKADVISRLWITYRKGFANIGGVGPSSDQGWGCMLRCGQMMLAQALMLRHLGRDWQWKPGQHDEDYSKLLAMFQDKKSAVYSIHQIAMMGQSEGKAIGQWFGPNTIAQVLKRISSYDSWSKLAIHIALDNVVIQDDVYKLCRRRKSSTQETKLTKELDLMLDQAEFSKFVNDAKDDSTSEGSGSSDGKETMHWKPLLLIIPLRLGLTDINPIYFPALKKCLTMHQSVGFIGGKPNHAHYFIGYLEDELIYLDPHTTQPIVDLSDPSNTDHSYHCHTPPSRMSFHKLDPSIALGFYCSNEKDFDDLCQKFAAAGGQSMFEVRKTWPQSWLTTDSDQTSNATGRSNRISLSDLNAEGSSNDDDEEFEII